MKKKTTAKKRPPEAPEKEKPKREVSIQKRTKAQRMRYQFYESRVFLAEERDLFFEEIAPGLYAELISRRKDNLALRECVESLIAAGLYSEFIPKKSVDFMVLRKLWRLMDPDARWRSFVLRVAPDYKDEERWFA